MMTEPMESPQLDVVVTGEIALSPVDLEAMAQAAEAAELERIGKLRALLIRLCAKRDQAICAKRDIECAMANSLRLYYGMSRLMEATKAQPVSGGVDSERTLKPGLLRARTDRWEARIVDMLSANPWELEPEPGTTQQQADGMKATIVDQLSLCRSERGMRRMAQDAARLGTGLMMGPLNKNVTRRHYMPPDPMTGTPGRMVSENRVLPGLMDADPWMFYPDPVDKAERAEFAFYAHIMSPLEVRMLGDGFDQTQIAELLNTEPDLGELATNIAQRNAIFNRGELMTGKYAVWRYTGTLERDDLEVLGLCGCEESDKDMPPIAMADIWFSQDFVLRSKLSEVPDDTRIPYYVFAPFARDDSMFGVSLPELGEGSQRAAEAAWTSALHNQSVSSGPIFLWRSGKIKFSDGQANIRGPKMLEVTDPDKPLNDCFAVETIPNVTEQALNIFDRALANMDEELNTSMWASPDGAGEAPTASGMAMILNAKSILQVRVACSADDEVITPSIERMVWWNCENNPDDSIKGNFIVRPSVQSQRLVKDVQVQQSQSFASMVLADPAMRARVDEGKILRTLADLVDAPVSEWILPDEEYQAKMEQQAQQPNPAMADAEYKMARAETERVKAEVEKLKAQRELAQSQQPTGDNSEAMANYQLKVRELEQNEQDMQLRLRIAQMREESTRLIAAVRSEENRIKASELAQDRREARNARLTETGMKIERDAQEMALKRQSGSGI